MVFVISDIDDTGNPSVGPEMHVVNVGCSFFNEILLHAVSDFVCVIPG